MRHCFSDVPEVFEETSQDLAYLLRDAADEVEKTKAGTFVNATIGYDCESAEYRVTLYVH